MKTEEFEKRLNQLDTLNDIRFRVKENVYRETIVYICVNGYKEVLLTINPPDDNVKQWYLDNDSSNCLFDVTSLSIYINILKLALKFLVDKNKE